MNIKKLLTVLTINFMVCLLAFPVMAQNTYKNYDEIEQTQDLIEDLYVDIYDIIDEYPDVTYNYVYEDGVVTGVMIEGIPDNRLAKQLELYLIDMDELKRSIYNMSNRTGIYYVTETEPKPSNGYNDFYNQLYNNIAYPEAATDNSVEGTVYVKFVVDHEGRINNILTAEDIEAPGDWIVKEMKKEAREAVKSTSGQWTPARVGEVPVAHWVVLPVQFKLEERPFSRAL